MASLSPLIRAVQNSAQSTGLLRAATGGDGVWVLTCCPGSDLTDHEVIGVYDSPGAAVPDLWGEVTGALGRPGAKLKVVAEPLGERIEISAGSALLRLERHTVQTRRAAR